MFDTECYVKIASIASGQFQSGLPIFRKKKINWNLRRTQPKVESHQRADFEHINHWFLLKVVIQ
ncbi:hypothetical protein DW964_05085 [Ruminococcus sp. AM47-2BH]|nr:hypothetical protein DW015_00770 [Ruminococcus sp. AF37-20]RGH33308.1 hypothetical protein DW964_05085 [Ruminococcus sp. AM47-2BH]